MRNNIARGFCAFFAAALLTGCSSHGGSSGVSIADFGGSGGVNYSGTSAELPAESTDSPESVPESPATTSARTPGFPGGKHRADHAGGIRSGAADFCFDAEEHAGRNPPPATSRTEKPQTTASATTSTSATSRQEESTRGTTATTAPAPDIPEYDYGSNSYQAVNYSEVKGIWISYIELAEIMQGQSKEGFRRNIAAVFDNCVSLGINTVYVHVRSHSDAYYKSELFPWSKYITGTLGNDPGYDPLAVMLKEAHSRSLSFQAWINPLRACSTGQIGSYGNFPVYSFATAAGMKGKYAVDVSGTYYLNPAYEEVTELIAAGASEILANYNVDGLHIDDYFYPTTDASFDSSAYSASGYSSLSDFRFANCDRMVKELYSAVKDANPTGAVQRERPGAHR